MAKKAAAKKTTKSSAAEKEVVMKKGRREIMVLLVAAVFVGFIVLAMNIGNVAKGGIEKVASQTLGVKVSIESLDISLQDKQVNVGGIKVANPQGYGSAPAIMVDKVNIAAEKITKELLVFNEVVVSGTDINMIIQENGTNLSTIKKNVKPRASAAESSSAKPVKVIIKRMIIDGTSVKPSGPIFKETQQPIIVENITLTGIGQSSNGVLASQAIAQILEHVSMTVTRSAAQAGLLSGMNTDALKDMGVSSGLIDDITDKVKGLFGN